MVREQIRTASQQCTVSFSGDDRRHQKVGVAQTSFVTVVGVPAVSVAVKKTTGPGPKTRERARLSQPSQSTGRGIILVDAYIVLVDPKVKVGNTGMVSVHGIKAGLKSSFLATTPV